MTSFFLSSNKVTRQTGSSYQLLGFLNHVFTRLLHQSKALKRRMVSGLVFNLENIDFVMKEFPRFGSIRQHLIKRHNNLTIGS